jgi:GAF domain-containing protein
MERWRTRSQAIPDPRIGPARGVGTRLRGYTRPDAVGTRARSRLTVHIEPDALRSLLARLRTLPTDHGVQPALQQVCEATVGVFGVAGAGLMMVDEGTVLRYVAATDDDGRRLEIVQSEVGEGPCVDALIHDRIVTTRDLHDDERWPKVAARMRDTCVRAVLGVPSHIGGSSIGSLNVFRAHPYDWDDSEIEALGAFNTVVESLLTSALLLEARDTVVEQLRHALDHRVTIERAVGVIMGRRGIGPVAAFNELRDEARSTRRKVVDLAAEVLDAVVRER